MCTKFGIGYLTHGPQLTELYGTRSLCLENPFTDSKMPIEVVEFVLFINFISFVCGH